ncbi:hypothetical protein TYRP_012533 [Tyrophagus putrescentiae]|nr:hypothetical protein TYRP_012533 [Tyrophagus putrescentiae]
MNLKLPLKLVLLLC